MHSFCPKPCALPLLFRLKLPLLKSVPYRLHVPVIDSAVNSFDRCLWSHNSTYKYITPNNYLKIRKIKINKLYTIYSDCYLHWKSTNSKIEFTLHCTRAIIEETWYNINRDRLINIIKITHGIECSDLVINGKYLFGFRGINITSRLFRVGTGRITWWNSLVYTQNTKCYRCISRKRESKIDKKIFG